MKLLEKYCIKKNHLQNHFRKNLLPEEGGGIPEDPSSGKTSGTRLSGTYSGVLSEAHLLPEEGSSRSFPE